jgi:hypothetical protein
MQNDMNKNKAKIKSLLLLLQKIESELANKNL